MLGLAALYVAGWTVVWWFATGPARRTAEIFGKIDRPGAFETPQDVERQLTAIYRESPIQAYADYAAHEMYRAPIAAAAAIVPECRTLVEEAMTTLPLPIRVYITLCIAIGGPPTMAEGRWTGTDPLRLPPDWVPFFRERLEIETSIDIAIVLAEILRQAGWSPTPDEVFARTRDARRPVACRVAELAVLSRHEGGTAAIYGALEAGTIPDDVSSKLIETRALELDPAFPQFLEKYALSSGHTGVAAASFTSIVSVVPAIRDRLWAAVSALPPGRRLPLMVSLTGGSGWPPAYRRWWVLAWDDEIRISGPAGEERLRERGLGNLSIWLVEEKDPATQLALRTIYDRLRGRR